MRGSRPTSPGIADGAMDVRAAQAGEIDELARLWFDAWQDGHAEIVPVELK